MNDWRTYDDVAETYERVHATRFAEVARDLVERLELSAPGRILDLGTGTGIAAEVAAAAGHDPVGVDESPGMLAVGHRVRPQLPLVAATAIDLPARDGVFDAVVGNLVLAHFTKVDTALFEAMRVLRPAGRIAFSSWADGLDEYQLAWREQIDTVVPREMLAPAFAEAAPGTIASATASGWRRSSSTPVCATSGPRRCSTAGSTGSTSTSTVSGSGRSGGSCGTCWDRRAGRPSWPARGRCSRPASPTR